MNDELIKSLFSLAIEMKPAEQYRLAFMIAENIGFCITKGSDEGQIISDIMKNVEA